MSSTSRNDDASDIQDEAAEEEEVLKLEEEVGQMAQKVLDYRTTLPDQLSSTLASLLASRRPVLPTRLLEEGPEPEMLTGPDSRAGFSQEDSEEAEKIRLLKEKILSNASALPVVLNRMKEYMARIDKLESSNVTIHPVFKRKRTS